MLFLKKEQLSSLGSFLSIVICKKLFSSSRMWARAFSISFQQLSKEERQALVSLSQKRTELLQIEMEKALAHIREEENNFCK